LGEYFPMTVACASTCPCMAKYRSFIMNPLGRPSSRSKAYTLRVYLCSLSGGAGPPYPVAWATVSSSATLCQLLHPSVKSLDFPDSPSTTEGLLRSHTSQWIQSKPHTGTAS